MPGVYNIGGGPANAISLLESIQVIESLTGTPSTVVHEAERHGDLRYFVADIEQAQRAFGFEPVLKPREGLSQLVEWAAANLDVFTVPA